MGGSVGLKGTDGQLWKRAVELGAGPVTPERTREFLGRIRNRNRFDLLVAPGRMGELYAPKSSQVVGKTGEKTTAEDTKRIAREMVSRGAALLIFVGGDGTPRAPSFLQRGKECSRSDAASLESKEVLAAFVARSMKRGSLYLLGPGTTVKAITDSMGVPKTLLGVDAMVGGRPVGVDLNEKGILKLMDSYEVTKLIVTPIGGNGFLFGRGNRQFTPEVLRRVGREGITVVATRDKLQRLEALRVDTGDFALDQTFSDYIGVIVGDNERIKMEVRC